MRRLAAAYLGVDLAIELERTVLLPGRSVRGRVLVTPKGALEARGVVVALVAVEHWRHDVTVTDAEGRTRTETRTSREELRRLPVQASGPVVLAAGEARPFDVELPVPPLGPASLDATEARLTWTVEARLDIEGGMDAVAELPVRVAQPVALLRAGVVRTGQFANFDSADVAADGIAGTLALDPVPLCAGEPFRAVLEAHADRPRKLQEMRAELRVEVESTVSGGRRETIIAWSGVIAAPPELTPGPLAIPFSGQVADQALPTIELPHGRASATMHVILAVPWAPDPHLVRDVTIATTREL